MNDTLGEDLLHALLDAWGLRSGRDMDCHYDHPPLMIQHLVWHGGYHHGQIKLALRATGCPVRR